jgi:bacterial/archaeal transporter family-2 protein
MAANLLAADAVPWEDTMDLWVYSLIVLGGALQTCGAAMNAQLFASVENRWLANVISFALILAFFVSVFAMFPTPLPKLEGLAKMPWWAPLGGLVGAVQVYAGLTLVHKVGAGAFVGVTVTAALVASLLLDHFGWLRVPVHPINAGRAIGALLMIGGIALLTKH